MTPSPEAIDASEARRSGNLGRGQVVALLVGFMAGSLWKIWPFRTVLESAHNAKGKLIVLRDALTTDAADPAGVYLGTRSGEVWGSRDDGASWHQLVSHLPDVLCVRAAVLP